MSNFHKNCIALSFYQIQNFPLVLQMQLLVWKLQYFENERALTHVAIEKCVLQLKEMTTAKICNSVQRWNKSMKSIFVY